MLHHISIPARDPAHVAAVLAALMKGRSFPFPGPLDGAFMALNGDAQGTAIEVYPETTLLVPGADEAPVVFTPGAAASHGAFHALLSVPTDRAAIEAIGAREGWRTKFCGRGVPGAPPAFHLIEFWIENRVLLELVTPDIVEEYTRSMQFDSMETVTQARIAATRGIEGTFA